MLSTAWLPLLSTLRLGGNVLSSLPSLYTVAPFLHTLDISNNALAGDIKQCLRYLTLSELLAEGNALDITQLLSRVRGHATSHVTELQRGLRKLQKRLKQVEPPHETTAKVELQR